MRPSLRFVTCLAFVFAAGAAINVGRAATTPSGNTGGARPATPEEIARLNQSLHQTADHYRRWAYTEHRIMRDAKGKVKSEVLLRHDPSLPYAEQWVPLLIDGKEPSDREKAKYRRRGERSAGSDSPFAGSPNSDTRNRRSLGELIEVQKSSIFQEDATHLVFEVPLLKIGNERFPPEKFQVLARLRRDDGRLENVSVRLRESFRSRLVVKVKSGEGSLDFASINPKYPPALVSIQGDANASILFVSIGGSMELKRTELRHVKLFDERFDVQIGTLKAIDF